MDYLTLEKPSETEYIVNKSRFIGWAKPVTSVEEANAFVNEIRALHREATHNVYAYCVRSPEYARFSDDGEPQGTAGKPVLEVLKKSGLTDACLVVTRYFGGILLGAGGLVRAYSHSASLAVEAAGVVQMKTCAAVRLSFDYNCYDPLQKLLPFHGAVTEETDFADKVTMTLRIPLENLPAFTQAVSDQTFGRAVCEKIGEKYGKFDFLRE